VPSSLPVTAPFGSLDSALNISFRRSPRFLEYSINGIVGYVFCTRPAVGCSRSPIFGAMGGVLMIAVSSLSQLRIGASRLAGRARTAQGLGAALISGAGLVTGRCLGGARALWGSTR
jgi:hypothetical protein